MTDVQPAASDVLAPIPSSPLVSARALRELVPHLGTALAVMAPASYVIAYVNQVGKASALGIPFDVISVSVGSIIGVFVGLLFVFYVTASWVGLFYRLVLRRVTRKGGQVVLWCAGTFVIGFPLSLIYGPANWDEWVWLFGGIAGLWAIIMVLAIMAATAQHFLPGPAGTAGRGLMRNAPMSIWDLIERVIGKWAMLAVILAVLLSAYSYSLGRADALNTQTYFVLDGTPQRALLAIYGDTVVLGYVPTKGGSLSHIVITQLDAGSLAGTNKQVGPLVKNCEPLSGCH